MRNLFEWTEEEKAAVTGSEQLAMLQRLVDFVNANLTNIKDLETDMTQVKTDIEDIKNPSTPK
jgi:prefoldin subunit 5